MNTGGLGDGIGALIQFIFTCFKWTFKAIMVTIGLVKKGQESEAFQEQTGFFKNTKGMIILRLFIGLFVLSLVGVILPPTVSGCADIVWIIYSIHLFRKAPKENKSASDSDVVPGKATTANIKAPPELVSDTLHGVVFGKMFNKKDFGYIIKPENLDGHVLVVGGVGSGKSSCVAIPSLQGWNESVFAIDIKGELYEKTKNNRLNIKVFNPLDEKSYGYDPFFCLHTSHNPAQEARAIAQAIIPLPPDTRDPFWIESAQNIFTAAILHYSAQSLSFLDTIEQIQSTTPKTLIAELCESTEREARYNVNSLADMEDKTLSSIMAELSRNIVHFITDKNLSSALSREKNITPDDLEFGNDVYINIPEHLLRQWKNLLTLIVNQFLTHFEQRSEADARPILFLLDEFPRLGKISAMLDGLATLRSKKIIICLIVQSLAQLDAIYGQNERKVISDACAYKAILGASDADTQEYFSRLVGTYDKMVTSRGTNAEAFTGINRGTSTNTQEMEKRIIKPEEFGRLTDIVLLSPFGFYRVEKAPYYTGE